MKAENIEDIYELSPAQQGILFHSLYSPESGVYITQRCFLLRGNLHVSAFEDAWQQVVARHTALRTSFDWETLDKTLQIVHREVKLPLKKYDWRELTTTEQQRRFETFLESDRLKGFELDQPPLIRLSLIRLTDNSYQIVLSQHHLILDGWSSSLVIKEVVELYEALSHNQAKSLALSKSYGDYIGWVQQQSLSKAEEFWRRVLGGIKAPTPLNKQNVDKVSNQEDKYDDQFLKLSTETTLALQSLAQQHHLTLNTLIHGAWAVLLSRYSGEKEIVYGNVVSGRPVDLAGAESMVGMFINTLPVRVKVDPEQPLVSWLKRLQVHLVEMRQYEHSPLVEVKKWSEVPQGVPLFESIIVFENYPVDRTMQEQETTLEVQNISAIERTNYPLTVIVEPAPELVLKIAYKCGCFMANTISRMLGHFQVLLQNMIAAPEMPLKNLPLLTQSEEHQLLREWNNTQIEYSQDQCIHQLFEAQVEKTPDAVAVVFENQQLTYYQLNQRANQLAHHLQSLEVGPEVLVGICVERSIEMVVGLLGILKAGGAYVPFDPNYPKDRLNYMLEDSAVKVLLIQQHLLSSLPSSSARIVCLDTDRGATLQRHQENLDTGVSSDNLAYVIYTSGSTGKPKGAMNTHQGIRNRLLWMQQSYRLTSSDRVLQKTPFSFDVSVWEFFWPLLTGAGIVVAKPEGHKDKAYLIGLISQQQITTIHFVPSMLQVFLQESNLENCSCLKRVFCSGESLSFELTRRFFSKLKCELHNLYGPTEAAIDVTFWRCQSQEKLQIIPIGRPIANTQIYLLDSYLQPVPLGVPGELYIGGSGLARGYLNRPELTCEKFIPNPFSNTKSQRLYKTGDLARYLLDGNIEFLGRIDHQVKVRGFRIELGEIEATLRQHPAVQEIVVLAREDQPGNKRLVAYIAPEKQAVFTTSKLRSFLQAKLPDYMMPSAFVTLEALPLTPNGKIDRQALPAPDTTRSEEIGTFVAPSTDAEKALADIWAQILRLEKVGIHDNFFELGGDSILSIQIVARANQAGLKLTPKQVFEHQTIAELATVAATGQVIQAQQGLVTGQVALTPIQHWFFEQNLPEAHHWNQSILLEVRQALDPQLLQQTMQSLLEHHDALRLRFAPQEASWQQWESHADEPTPFTLLDLSTVSEAEQSLVISTAATDLQASLNLSAGPLMRVVYFDFGTTRPARLLWVIHHLAVDGVSWRILLEDFQRVYEQLTQGQEIQLPPKTTSFQRWAERLQEYGRSEVAQQELDYWLSQSHQPVNPIPVDFPGGENTVASASVVSTALSQADTQALLQEVPKAYQTRINDVLLTALAQALAEWTGNRSLLVDLEGHGREDLFEDVDLSRTVGWFTTLFPVVLNIEASTSPNDALKTIKEQIRSIPKRGIGYGVLRHLNQEAAEVWQHQSQVDISFNYLGQADRSLQESFLFVPAQEPNGTVRSLQSNRSHLLDISGIVAGGQLRLNWTYSETIHRRATIETLAERCIEALRALISQCQSLEVIGHTPSESQEANVDQNNLDQSIPYASRNAKLPLSFAQARLWFLEQLDSGSYYEPSAIRLAGFLNVAAIEQSFNEIVRRHEVFRTTFPVVDGQPIQLIAPFLGISLPMVNLCELSEAEQQKEVQWLVEEWSQSVFDLTQDPLLKIVLLKLSEQEHLLMFGTHHIISDRWSMGVLIKELAILYKAFSQGQPSPLPELPIQYADFAVWQRQWLQGEALENQLSYWRRQLAGALTKLNLQKIAGRPPIDTKKPESAAQSFLISTHLSQQIKVLSRKQRVTLFMTLLSAFQILLYRYTNQKDIVVGTDVAGRNRAEVEPLIGFFINLLVLRTDLSGNPTFLALLDRVREVTLGAYEHQDLPFAKLVESLRPDRATNTTPLFEILFVFQNIPRSVVEFSGLTLTPVEVSKNKARFGLALFLEETEQGIFGNWRYRTDLFDAEAIARLSRNFEALLCSIAQNPDARIDALDMLSESEKQRQITQKAQRERAKFKKFKTIKPKAVNLPQKELVKTDFLHGQSLPYVIQPDADDVDLADWATGKREFIETNLLKHGAILFRGFKINSIPEFEKVAGAICPKLFGDYGDLPREGLGANVYGSTPYPSDQAILFHNESSHLQQWPLKIWFFCVQPAQSGGETPIVDCRKFYQILDPKLRERFEQKQLMYARNYIEGLDVSWQDFFHTSDKEAVEARCRQSGIDFEWLPDNGLRTYKIRPAVSRHPKTGESVFFNQVQLHHISCLESAVRKSLLSALDEDKLPRNVYYGDGSPIEDSVMAEIGDVYRQAKISFPWEQGDILMLDNMLVAHGRNPYVGSRKIVVAMGEMIDSQKVERV